MNGLLIPSYGQGFARCAAEAEYPGLWDGLVGAWAPYLGPTGLTLFDQSGRRNNGTLTNMDPPTDWGPDYLDCDGVDDRVIFSTADTGRGINCGKENSASIWIKSTDTAAVVLGAKGGGSGSGGYFFYFGGADLYYNANGAGDSVAHGGLVDAWTHWLVSRSGTSITWYTNGALLGTGTLATDKDIYSSTIGALYGGSFPMAGQISDVSIWQRALVASEAQQLYRDPHAVHRLRRRVFASLAVGFGGQNIILGSGIAA